MIKIFWTALFLITALMGVYFTFVFGKDFFEYISYNSRVPAKILEWQVREMKNGKFAVAAKFSYQINENSYVGLTVIKDRHFLNDYAAMHAVKNKEIALEEAAWVSPHSPEKSTLQRRFPTNLLIKLLIVYGVISYFSFLKTSVEKRLFSS
ncbi:MAG TPA: hypothetical protein VLG44_05535 [Chlamydiales bacterium]|nr:hypothetical protein [Chlamydiales bacterium]